jgi:hypothetical protein
MEDRLRSVSSCLSLNAVDTRGAYYSLNQNDNRNLASSSLSSNAATAAAASVAANSTTTTNALCMLVNGRRVQQRYKLLTDGLVQVCRVPHARNIIEKIRFSRFLRRWEDHYINLGHNEIFSKTVC